jgi:hypothetical protein
VRISEQSLKRSVLSQGSWTLTAALRATGEEQCQDGMTYYWGALTDSAYKIGSVPMTDIHTDCWKACVDSDECKSAVYLQKDKPDPSDGSTEMRGTCTLYRADKDTAGFSDADSYSDYYIVMTSCGTSP